MDTIKVSKDTAQMLDIIRQCDDLEDSLDEMTDGFNMLDKYKEEIDNRMHARVAKIRNEVLDFLVSTIRDHFLESEHQYI